MLTPRGVGVMEATTLFCGGFLMTDKFEQYKNTTADIRKLEVAIENFRKNRSALAKAMLEENGKEHIYDLDGVSMIVSTSKNGSHFLTPKHKGGRGKKAAIEGSEAAPAGLSQDAPRAKRGRKPKAKKAIINGQLVEVNIIEAQAELKPASRVEAQVESSAKEEIQLQKTIEGEASLLGGNSLAAEAVVVPKEPEPAPKEEAPVDPLEAALAEIEKAN
jgi:hypothetical protein